MIQLPKIYTMYTSVLLWSLVGSSVAFGQTIPKTIHNPVRKEAYYSGVVHEAIMHNKTTEWEARAAAGEYDSSRFSALNYTACVDGTSAVLSIGQIGHSQTLRPCGRIPMR